MSEIQLDDGRRLAVDEDGYLREWRDWTPEAAKSMAASDGIELGERHFLVLEILREYFADYEIAPPMRALVKLVRERTGEGDLTSRELYRLFPEGPARQACRYAGLPRPVSCI